MFCRGFWSFYWLGGLVRGIGRGGFFLLKKGQSIKYTKSKRKFFLGHLVYFSFAKMTNLLNKMIVWTDNWCFINYDVWLLQKGFGSIEEIWIFEAWINMRNLFFKFWISFYLYGTMFLIFETQWSKPFLQESINLDDLFTTFS